MLSLALSCSHISHRAFVCDFFDISTFLKVLRLRTRAAKPDLGPMVSRKGQHVGTPHLVVSFQPENTHLPQNTYLASNSFVLGSLYLLRTLFTLAMTSADLGNKTVPLEITEGIVVPLAHRAFASVLHISRLST